MRVEGVGRRVACRSRFCVTTFCADADRVSKQPPLMPKARDADKERVEKLFKDDGVTPYTLDLRAKYGDPLVLDESLVGDWTVIKIGSQYVCASGESTEQAVALEIWPQSPPCRARQLLHRLLLLAPLVDRRALGHAALWA